MMDSRSRNEAAIGDTIWFTNLRLLGLHSAKLEITPSMFDHPNPSAFQNVFYKLLELLSKERVSQDLRDCWPVLDKRQEAEFRRKVVGQLKEYQKEHPEDLPYTNPSLFQSPGGRKFIVFLNKFTSLVLKVVVSRSDTTLQKPLVKKGLKELRRKLYSNLVIKAEESLKGAVKDHEDAEELEEKARKSGELILRKHGEYKKRLEVLETKQCEGQKDTDMDSLEVYDEKSDFVKKSFEELVQTTTDIKKAFEVIEYVSDDSVEKVRLNLSELPPSSLNSNLCGTYQSLLAMALQCSEKVLSEKIDLVRPGSDTENIRKILLGLKAVEENLENNKSSAKEAVGKMLGTSQTIDWPSYSLVETKFDSKEALLPPTPSIVEQIKGRREEKVSIRNLQLLTPDAKLSTPSLRLGVSLRTPVRSGPPTAALSRRFLLANDQLSQSRANSPHLKPKTAFGEMSRIGGETNLEYSTTARSTSTGSIGDFTPDLCSTAAVETFSELADSAKLDTTKSKIEIYRQVLDKLKNRSAESDKSGLMEAWTSHRESVSPLSQRTAIAPRVLLESPTSPPSSQVPLPDTPKLTPVSSREPSPMKDLLISRLDQLMTSLTLNDSNGTTILNVSLDEVELLSPNLV